MNIHESEYRTVYNGIAQHAAILQRQNEELEAELIKVRGNYSNAAAMFYAEQKEANILRATIAELQKQGKPITEKTTEPTTP